MKYHRQGEEDEDGPGSPGVNKASQLATPPCAGSTAAGARGNEGQLAAAAVEAPPTTPPSPAGFDRHSPLSLPPLRRRFTESVRSLQDMSECVCVSAWCVCVSEAEAPIVST